MLRTGKLDCSSSLLLLLIFLDPTFESEVHAEILCSMDFHKCFYPSIPGLASVPWAMVTHAREACLPTGMEILMPQPYCLMLQPSHWSESPRLSYGSTSFLHPFQAAPGWLSTVLFWWIPENHNRFFFFFFSQQRKMPTLASLYNRSVDTGTSAVLSRAGSSQ